MSKRVFSSEYASLEEIEGVKEVLSGAGIDYHEVRNSRLWLGGGALYVNNPEDYDRAREVIEVFQEDWRRQAKQNPAPNSVNWKLLSPLLLILVVFILVTAQSLLA